MNQKTLRETWVPQQLHQYLHLVLFLVLEFSFKLVQVVLACEGILPETSLCLHSFATKYLVYQEDIKLECQKIPGYPPVLHSILAVLTHNPTLVHHKH